jgi:hypothetical protein
MHSIASKQAITVFVAAHRFAEVKRQKDGAVCGNEFGLLTGGTRSAFSPHRTQPLQKAKGKSINLLKVLPQ